MEDYHLVDAKQEYTTYLVSILEPTMFNGFRDIYEQAKKLLNGNSIYKNFQVLLSNVPNWNSYMLEKEVTDIQKETGCDWLDNLITAVFVSHSKILTSVKVGNYRPKTKKIDLKIPDTTNFIHQCYLEASRNFYKNPFLFLDDPKQIKPEEYLKNTQTSREIIKEAILTTIRKLLPFKSILNEYLSLENNVLAIGAPTTVETITPSIAPTGYQQSIDGGDINQKLITNGNDDLNQKIIPMIKTIEPAPITVEQNVQEEESSSESEKEIVMKGKELNLDDLEINEEKIEEPSLVNKPKKRTPRKPKNVKGGMIKKPLVDEESINSKTVEQLVNDIRKEFKEKEEFKLEKEEDEKSINLDILDNISLDNLEKDDKSINLDYVNLDKLEDKSLNLDFFKQAKEDKSEDSETTIDRLNNILGGGNKKKDRSIDLSGIQNSVNSKVNIQKLEETPKVIKEKKQVKEEQQLVLFNNQKALPIAVNEGKESLDIEKIQQILKEEGTIVSNKKIESKLPFENLIPQAPIVKQKVTQEVKHEDKDRSNDIKKISIKYSNAVPIGKKKGGKKAKTTLIDEADDDDSSEMVF